MVETREEWEKKIHQIIMENKKPLKIKFHEVNRLQWASSAKVGSFKRKAKGREYVSPRILLHHYFKKHIGKECRVFEGKASIETWPAFQNVDILILAFQRSEP